MGYFLVASSLWAGWCLSGLVPLRWYKAERLAVAGFLGLFSAAWLFFLLSLLLPYTFAIPLAFLIQVGGSGFLTWKLKKGTEHQPYFSLPWLFLSLVSTSWLAYLLYTHMLGPGEGDGYYSVGPVWGDLALHLSLISHFAAQDGFSFAMPLLQGAKLTYPFLIDFLSAVFYRSGLPLQLSLILPGLILGFACVQLLFFMVLRFFKKTSAAGAATALFYGGGSVAGLQYLYEGWKASGVGIIDFLKIGTDDYTYLPEKGLHVYNAVTGFLLPQRGILFGLPVFFLALIFLFEGRKRPVLLYSAAVLIGFLPFAHIHTFLIAGSVLGYMAFAQAYDTGKLKSHLTYAFLCMVVIALPQLLWQFFGSYHSGFVTLKWGWLREEDQGFLVFWLRNWGPLFLVLITTPLLFWKKLKDPFFRLLYIPFAILFVACNIAIFQPNPYDNTKFFLYVFLVACIFGGYMISLIKFRPLQILLVGALALPGIGSLSIETVRTFSFLDEDDIALAAQVKRLTPKEAVILTSDRHNHPVSTITGRQVVLGYRGWLWTYGIDYRPVESDVSIMFSGRVGTEELFQKYGITHVVIGPSELRIWSANKPYFDANYPVIYRSDNWTVYAVGK
ncbi:MAG: hypothetical protein K0S20_657 [Patescibacteria group bacterium]|jgi:hypothetical protein|nr:hypothetical protein [Patescibacteria group bacterium]